MRVALVHDWLTGMRGGERVLEALVDLFPDADLYTLFHVPGSTAPAIEGREIRTSPLDRVPGRTRHYRKLLPLFPWAIESFRLEGYDLVVSSSHCVAKAIPVDPATPHLCYCHTPMRYVWDQADAYLGRGLRRAAARPLVRALRRFDRRTSSPRRVTRFVANSRTVAERIRRHYHREAVVVPPPVDAERFRPAQGPPDDFYLLVTSFSPYKRVDVAIDAFRGSGRRLLIVGDGPGRRRWHRRRTPGVEFLGRVSDRELAELYTRCRALIQPQEEDFGLIAVEAQAAGRPVVAFASGGARETVRPLHGPLPATGVWFHEQTGQALREAVSVFERHAGSFDPAAIRSHSLRFSRESFRRGMARTVDEMLRRPRSGAGGVPGRARPAAPRP